MRAWLLSSHIYDAHGEYVGGPGQTLPEDHSAMAIPRNASCGVLVNVGRDKDAAPLPVREPDTEPDTEPDDAGDTGEDE